MHNNAFFSDRLQSWCEERRYELCWMSSSATVELPSATLRRALGLTFFRDGRFHASIYVTDGRALRGRDHCFYRDYLDQTGGDLERVLDQVVRDAYAVSAADLSYVARSARG